MSPTKIVLSIITFIKIFRCCFCYVEIGSDFVGVEFHNFSICPQRISFYYPVANSIDNITDYWTRDRTHIMRIGYEDSKGQFVDFGKETFKVLKWTPFTVEVFKSFPYAFDISRKIQFLENSPSMAITYSIENVRKAGLRFRTELDLQMRTCADYDPVNLASMEFVKDLGNSIVASYANESLKKSELFFANADASPVYYSFKEFSSQPFMNTTGWVKNPWMSFMYDLKQGENTTIVQLIGQVSQGDAKSEIQKVLKSYEKEIEDFENHVLDRNKKLPTIRIDELQPSIEWAQEVLTTSRHFLQNEILPMPCPAEYNFFFTHDTLMTDLVRVLYDVDQVKNDLLFIASLADMKDLVIPHAYYWKDDSYVTEFAKDQNWNHMWFNIISARYLRATNDVDTIEKIFPLLHSSITISMSNVNEKSLFTSGRPDWWDIGQNLGPKTYHTTLLIEALREFCFLSTKLGNGLSVIDLKALETFSVKMEESLEKNLWDEKSGYLMNYFNDGSMDTHFFTGSLLTVHFGILKNTTKSNRLIETAKNILLDPKIGVFNAFPMDFDQLIEKYVFQGNEAGMKGLYFNGGIWNQGNAWYALAMISMTRDREDISKFVKDIVSMQGISASPNGQPAYYEYRDSITLGQSQYGKIDKPQFMWAAGYFLYTMYHLNFLRVDPWNIVLDPPTTQTSRESFSCYFFLSGDRFEIELHPGKGEFIKVSLPNGNIYPSCVLPEEIATVFVNGKISVELTEDLEIEAYIRSLSSTLLEAKLEKYENGFNGFHFSLTAEIRAFEGHVTEITLLSKLKASKLTINDVEMSQLIKNESLEHSEGFLVVVSYDQFEGKDILKFFF